MKGFVFTLDAIFSLVFAAAAVAALVYVSYSGYIPPSVQSSEVASISGTLLSTNLQTIGQTNPLYGAGSLGTWSQYGADEGYSFASAYGPVGPYLLYTYNAPANIIPAPVVSGGYVAFIAGNQVFELNASTGVPATNYPVTNANTITAPPVFYGGYLIYANSTGYLTAISATNGNTKIWQSKVGYTKLTAPLQLEGGLLVVSAAGNTGFGSVYFLSPTNGVVVENDQTALTGSGANVIWIAHHKGAFYVGQASGKTFNGIIRGEFVNASLVPSNSFASYGSFMVQSSANTLAMYTNLTAAYSKASGVLNLTSVPDYPAPLSSAFKLPSAVFNTTPSIGGNVTYLLANGINFEAFRQTGQLFNVTLPKPAAIYSNYSDIALAYGNAYLADGNSLYVFGSAAGLSSNSSLLSALGSLYISARGSLANYLLYNRYGAGNIGIFINGTYAPDLHVAKFNGVNSYIAIPGKPKISPEASTSAAMSLCGWYKINTLTGYNGLIFQGTQAPSSGSIPEFIVDNAIERGFTIYSSTGNLAASYNTPLNANVVQNWYSFCFTYNTSSAAYYLNGTKYTANDYAANVPSVGTGAIVIGAGTGGFSNVTVGNIQLYNTSIPSSRVTAIFNGGMFAAPANVSGLVGWWPLLGDGNDYSGSGLVGFPSNVLFSTSNYIPASLGRSVQIGGSATPIQLTNNGKSNLYNVSVVTWSS